MANIVWMQTGASSGDSMALLCADRPSIENLVEHYGLAPRPRRGSGLAMAVVPAPSPVVASGAQA